MSLIINIGQAYPPALPTALSAARANASTTAAGGRYSDTVEFSHTALNRAVVLSSLIIATTAAIRAEIEAGNYETPQRIESTVERILDVIG